MGCGCMTRRRLCDWKITDYETAIPIALNMDRREYEYITKRPDTFPISTLRDMRAFLVRADLHHSVLLVDHVIAAGYIQPPDDYPWHGCYRIVLDYTERQNIVNDLNRVSGKISLNDKDSSSLRQIVDYFSRRLKERPLSYAEYKALYPPLDLRDISLEDFQDLVFLPNADDELPEEQRTQKLIHTWVYGDAIYIAQLWMRLFKESGPLLQRYTDSQLEQGLWWAMSGSLLRFTAYELVWNERLPLDTRVELIESMYFLYSELFLKNPLRQTCHMWWDSFAYCFFRVDPDSSESVRVVQDAMFATLNRILLLDTEWCQAAALHGLGHLRHRNTKVAISAYLDRNRGKLDPELVRYAEACMSGNVM